MYYLHESDKLYKDLDADRLIKALLAKGWIEMPVKPKYMRVFKNSNTVGKNSFRQVIVPLDKTLRDYEDVIRDCIRTFAIDEQCTVETILNKIK